MSLRYAALRWTSDPSIPLWAPLSQGLIMGWSTVWLFVSALGYLSIYSPFRPRWADPVFHSYRNSIISSTLIYPSLHLPLQPTLSFGGDSSFKTSASVLVLSLLPTASSVQLFQYANPLPIVQQLTPSPYSCLRVKCTQLLLLNGHPLCWEFSPSSAFQYRLF